jgi:hypothetical protein
MDAFRAGAETKQDLQYYAGVSGSLICSAKGLSAINLLSLRLIVRYWGENCLYSSCLSCQIVGLEPYFYLFSDDLTERLLQC